MRLQSVSFALVAVLASSLVQAQYTLRKTYQGNTFFQDWTFFGDYDYLNSGQVNFLNREDAIAQKLVSVDSATGNAFIRLDNFTTITQGKRNSVRINTNDLYGVGSVWIADMVHVPYGCGVWSAFWSTPTNSSINYAEWPTGGEIDTFEAWNIIKESHYTVHTPESAILPVCVATNPVQTSNITTTDCGTDSGNTGCTSNATNPNTVGPNFSNVGGGMFVTEFASTGISTWFFERQNIPQGLQGNVTSVDPSTLGKPAFNIPSTNCNIDSIFKPQSLIFDINLCGAIRDFVEADFNATCPGSCLFDWVYGPPANFSSAYFEVKSVKVFQTIGATIDSNSTSTSASTPASNAPSAMASSRSSATGVVPAIGISLLIAMACILSMLLGFSA